jgi:hypothetical protein
MNDRPNRRLEYASLGGADLAIASPLRDGVYVWIPERLRLFGEDGPSEWVEVDWQWTGREQPVPADRVARLLPQFARLADASPRQILAFARRWGVLSVCISHKQPTADDGRESWHAMSSSSASPVCDSWAMPSSDPRYLDWNDIASPLYSTPVDAWRKYARQLQTICGVVADLGRHEPVRHDEWEIVTEAVLEGCHAVYAAPLWQPVEPRQPAYGLLTPELNRQRLTMQQLRERVAHVSSMWLEFGNVRPVVAWAGDPPRVQLTSSTLVGLLGIQLAASISSTHGMWRCDGGGPDCEGYLYQPHRKPQRLRFHYCTACRENAVPGRLWAQRKRATRTA